MKASKYQNSFGKSEAQMAIAVLAKPNSRASLDRHSNYVVGLSSLLLSIFFLSTEQNYFLSGILKHLEIRNSTAT